MKTPLVLLAVSLGLTAKPGCGQGTFIYDQQSSVEGQYSEYAADVRTNQPFGQSFTPNLSSVGFVRFYLGDGKFGAGSNLTAYVTLHSDSNLMAMYLHFSRQTQFVSAVTAENIKGLKTSVADDEPADVAVCAAK